MIHLKTKCILRVRWDAAEHSDESQDGKSKEIRFNNHPTARVACASSLCMSPFSLYAIL
jgi:hypothetical protein